MSATDKDVHMSESPPPIKRESEQDEESHAIDPDATVITTKWEMMFHIFQSVKKANDERDHDKANRLAASLLRQDECPMIVAAGCHRVLSVAPGTHEGQLAHARISLEIYEEALQDMVPGPGRERIQKAVDVGREMVAAAEERLRKEEEAGPVYYTDAEWEEHVIESFGLKTQWPEYFESNEKETDEKEQNDGQGLATATSGTQTSTQSTKRSQAWSEAIDSNSSQSSVDTQAGTLTKKD